MARCSTFDIHEASLFKAVDHVLQLYHCLYHDLYCAFDTPHDNHEAFPIKWSILSGDVVESIQEIEKHTDEAWSLVYHSQPDHE